MPAINIKYMYRFREILYVQLFFDGMEFFFLSMGGGSGRDQHPPKNTYVNFDPKLPTSILAAYSAQLQGQLLMSD